MKFYFLDKNGHLNISEPKEIEPSMFNKIDDFGIYNILIDEKGNQYNLNIPTPSAIKLQKLVYAFDIEDAQIVE